MKAHQESFINLITWIAQRTSKLEALKAYYDEALFGIFRTASLGDFTPFEIEVLELVIHYCRRFYRNAPIYAANLKALKTSKDYYRRMDELALSGEKIRGDGLLSSLIGDSELAKRVMRVER